jgi:hypothetical protein
VSHAPCLATSRSCASVTESRRKRSSLVSDRRPLRRGDACSSLALSVARTGAKQGVVSAATTAARCSFCATCSCCRVRKLPSTAGCPPLLARFRGVLLCTAAAPGPATASAAAAAGGELMASGRRDTADAHGTGLPETFLCGHSVATVWPQCHCHVTM